MTPKHTPATPLPWRVVEHRGKRPRIFINGPLREDGQYGADSRSIACLYNLTNWQADAAYIAHAANAYQLLVKELWHARAGLLCAWEDTQEGIRSISKSIECVDALLRSLGESE